MYGTELYGHDLYGPDLLKLLAAIAAGALIGLERELHDKPAGFRTNILICLGAALFTLLSVRMAGAAALVDRTRIAAQIVTGVGFLGAGTIIRQRGQVIGLTTAATIWAVASVGMAFGAGEFGLGAVGTVLVGGVVFGLSWAEALITRWRTLAVFHVTLDPNPAAAERVREIASTSSLRLRTWRLSKREAEYVGRLVVTGPGRELEALAARLIQEKVVRSLRRV